MAVEDLGHRARMSDELLRVLRHRDEAVQEARLGDNSESVEDRVRVGDEQLDSIAGRRITSSLQASVQGIWNCSMNWKNVPICPT